MMLPINEEHFGWEESGNVDDNDDTVDDNITEEEKKKLVELMTHEGDPKYLSAIQQEVIVCCDISFFYFLFILAIEITYINWS